MSANDEPKVGIDIGLSAKASLQVSGEIPADAMGRLVDVFTDIIRPFSERRGLKADLIRLQRETVAIEIAQKARERAKVENRPIQPLSNKFLVPFFEKASLEEPGDVMIERWSDLLASAAFDPSAAHPRYVQILSELTRDEVLFLHGLALYGADNATNRSVNDYNPEEFRPERIAMTLQSTLIRLTDRDLQLVARDLGAKATELLSRPGVALTNCVTAIRTGSGTREGPPLHVVFGSREYYTRRNLLASLSLINENVAYVSDPRFISIRIDYISLTPLGVEFLIRCDRELLHVLRPTTP